MLNGETTRVRNGETTRVLNGETTGPTKGTTVPTEGKIVPTGETTTVKRDEKIQQCLLRETCRK